MSITRSHRLQRRRRRALAQGLRRAVRDAAHAGPRVSAALPVQRRAVGPVAESMMATAALLDGDDPVGAAGLERLRRLLTDGASPLYAGDAGTSLIEYLWWIEDGLRLGDEDDLPVDVAGLELGIRVADR